MTNTDADLVVLFENEDWQRPLFDVLDQREISYDKHDLKAGAFLGDQPQWRGSLSHLFSAKTVKVRIPPRPFLEVTREDEEEIRLRLEELVGGEP